MNIQNIYEKSTASAFFVASSVMMSNLFLEDLEKFLSKGRIYLANG